MTARFVALLLLALVCGPACAQNLPRDHAVYDLTATRDLLLGQTTIYGRYTNTSPITQPAPKVTFALYDGNGQEVGRLVEHADADLAPGQTWHIRASTPLVFTRYIPVGAPLPPPPASIVHTRVRRKPVRKAIVHAKPVAKPAPKKTYTYRKPELYDWSKHRSPVPPRHTRTSVRPAAHPAPHPVARPAAHSPSAPAPAVKTAPAQPSAAPPASK
ncbi:FxLYD domain-containing protein [Bordetella sp. FB-8]|uniref:FxLYD domain-containing protein n=1 Tax=Bordetella sp. FB-8 TaxID=1159870 RepID=UPI00036A8418|nr:FxLYD domain-containing protein [Bordetella sp. FB-8]